MNESAESREAVCKVSICVPTFNGSRYLRLAIESARAQTFRDFELLIVDDDSTDDTVAIAEEAARVDSRVRVYRNPRRLGLAGNWNRCLELASGEWIKFLFQDDSLQPACVERLFKLGTDSGATLVACRRKFEFDSSVGEEFKRSFLVHAAENDLNRRFPDHAGTITAGEFAAYAAKYPALNCIGEPTATMFRRSAVAEFGNFNADLMQAIDWEYWLRIAVTRGLSYLDESLATFRLHDGGATFANMRRPLILDLLIIYHELAYKPHYAAVRAAARETGVDLKQKLFGLCRSAQPGAVGSNGTQSSASVSAEDWNRLVKSYPRLRFPQLNYLMLRSVDKLKSQLKTRTRTTG
jgi:glycosyltransferase involved in cell wall biosynthesis